MSTALDHALAAIDGYPGDGDELIRAKCRAMLRGYNVRWADAGYTALEVEQVIKTPLWNPATEAKSRTFQMAGKIDVYLESPERRRLLMDHKFTSMDILDPDSPFWRQLAVEGQINQYMLLKWAHGEKPDGAIWDAIRRPTISPKKLTKAERASAVAERKYFGVLLSMESLAALQVEERETIEMYEARLTHDCINERPEWYFQRRTVPRLDADMLEYAEDLWQHSQDILASRKVKRLPKNSGACMTYNSPCVFLGICSGHDTPDSDKWKRKDVQHPELNEHGDMDALTNSRIRTFQTCRVKHHYQYELGIERYDEEEKEALYSGTLLHVGLEAWWRSFIREESENGNASEISSPAIGVGKHSAATA